MFIKRLIAGFVPHIRAEVFEAIKGLRTNKCPFSNLPEHRKSPHALTEEVMRQCVWVKPERRCEVEFVERTKVDGYDMPNLGGLLGETCVTKMKQGRAFSAGPHVEFVGQSEHRHHLVAKQVKRLIHIAFPNVDLRKRNKGSRLTSRFSNHS